MRSISNRPLVAVMAVLVPALFLTVALTVAGFHPGTAAAETSNVTSTADTRLVGNASTTNYGGATTLGADGDEPGNSGKDAYSLLRWNLSSVPAGSRVDSVSVTLNVTNPSTQTYQAYRLKRAWGQSAATWLLYASGSPWELAGARGSLDRGAQVGSVSPSTTGKRTFTLSPALVQRWLDYPASNRGIVIANAANTDGFDFSSREAADASLRPSLSVNYSATTTTPPPTGTCTRGEFLAEYRNELRTFSSQPVLARCEAAINNDWGSGSPGSGVNADSFTTRWVGTFDFEASDYEFAATADDGVRLWVDGQLLIDQWRDQGATTYKATKTLAAGAHEVRVEYYENGGQAVAKASWAKVASSPPTGDPDMTGWTSLEKYNYDRRIKGIDKFFALDTKGVSHSPYIGEINGPNSRGGPHSSDVPQWNALMDKMLGELVKRDSTISGFSVDENQIWGGYSLNSYSSGSDGTSNPAIDTPNEQAPIWEKHVASGKVGHNEAKGQGDLEAGQYAGSGLVRTWAGSAVSPTTGKDTFQYLKDKGYTNVRLGFRWELLQPQLGGSLNTQNLTNFKTAVADARAAGLTVIIEPHNYAWYKVSDSTYYKMGDGRLTGAHLADLWERLSTEFKSDSGVVYDLMNEPGVQGDIPLNGYSSQAKAWEAYAQQSVDAIRANGDTKLIYVPTWRTDTSNAAGYHPQGPWINDPAKNHQYTFHIYFWINGWQNGGNYSLDYPTENNNAKAAGY